jgi:hypothetical protein
MKKATVKIQKQKRDNNDHERNEDAPNTEGAAKAIRLTRGTELTTDEPALGATPDERGRRYQEAFETVYDESGRLTPLVPTALGYRIMPATSTFPVDQYNQNALPGVEEDDVAEVTIKELRKADKDYPGGHNEAASSFDDILRQ